VAGEGEEHIVEGRAAQGQVGDLQPSRVQAAHHLGQEGGALADRQRDLARTGHHLGRARAQVGHGRGGLGRPGPVDHPHRQQVAPDPRLELVGGALGDHPAAVDHRDVVGQPVRLLQVLGGEQQGGAVADQLADDVPEREAAARVQPGGRLVQEQHLGAADQAGAQVEAAAHPARVGLDRAVGGVGELEALQHLVGPPPGLGPWQVVEAADQVEVLPPGEVLVDGRVLAGQPDDRAQRLGVADDVEAGHPGRARVRVEQGGQDPDDGGLAGPVGPEQAQDGPGGGGQVDPVHRLDGAEGPAQVLGDDRCVAHAPPLLSPTVDDSTEG
jgi:hypothetical protein